MNEFIRVSCHRQQLMFFFNFLPLSRIVNTSYNIIFSFMRHIKTIARFAYTENDITR